MKVRVVAYKDKIIMVPDRPREGVGDEWWPTGNTRGGCVLGNTKANLGVSREALDLMRQVQRNHDAIGDLGWWWCTDDTYAFSWWGPHYRIVDVYDSEADRNFQVYPHECAIIPNDVPEKAHLVIDADPGAAMWLESELWEYPKDAPIV